MTPTASGRSRTAIPSSLSIADGGLLGLLLLGVLVALLHAKLRYGLGLPGHHGLEWMTAALFARFISPRNWSALAVGCGAAAGEMIFAADLLHLAKSVPLYLVCGALVDLLYRGLPQTLRGVAAAAAIGALAHSAKALLQLGAVLAFGAELGLARHGLLFPLLTHAAFGLVGGACGAVLARGLNAARSGRRDGAAAD